ncbi:MAG: endolytic transglycosylase MltG [Candidatus Sungbacteria bacterium]|nr:endolytic transglycosylase MltG [Candidatus Sungbacteria bacterium]
MDELIRELKNQGVLRLAQVEAAFRAIDRKDFVRPEDQAEAYANYPLPIGQNQTISQPYTVAFMLDLLDPRPGEKILDVGAGSGWHSAILAYIVSQNDQIDKTDKSASGLGEDAAKRLHQAQRFTKRSDSSISPNGKVCAVERIPELCRFAKANIEKYNFIKKGVVEFFCRDATAGLPEKGPFDKIIAAAGSTGDIPGVWRSKLKIGGKIVAPVDGSVWLFEKKPASASSYGEAQWEEKEFPGFAFVPLISGQKPDRSRRPASTSRRRGERSNGVNQKGEQKPRRTAVIVLLLITGILAASYSAFKPVHLKAPKEIEISPGAGSRAIADALKAAGLIRSKWAFVIYAALSGRAAKLKPGVYYFAGEVGIPELAGELESGDLANERLITIPEGWDLRDIGQYLESIGVSTAKDFWAITGAPAADRVRGRQNPPADKLYRKFAFLSNDPPSFNIEGFLFPDTYRVFRNASAEEIIEKLLENFERKITPDLRAEILRQKKTLFAVTTMASLIEKEIPDPQERRIAAGILWRRLEAGMPLQVDATINYITGKHQSPSADDLKINSPYNTYLNRGLPPGPIANPGLEAIRAAVFPATNDYAYYLSARDGRTIFSRTLEEHNAAKARFLR